MLGDELSVSKVSRCSQISIGKNNLKLGLTISGKTNENPCSLTIDTAADITVINPNVFQNNLNHLKNVNKQITVQNVSGDQFPHIALKHVTISVGNTSVDLQAIFANIPDQCLLGLDFLQKTGLLKDFQSLINRKFDINSSNKIVSIKQVISKDIPQNIPEISTEIPDYLIKLYEDSCQLLNPQERKQVEDFLLQFQNCFSKNSEDLGRYKGIRHQIVLKDCQPVKQNTRRIPLHYQQEVFELLKDMKKQGIIEPSTSSWSSPVVLTKKKDGSLRFCVDYRLIND